MKLTLYLLLLLIAHLIPFSQGVSLNNYEIVGFRADHLAHFLVFMPLPYLISRLFPTNNLKSITLTIIFALTLATSFEFIHYFLPYRAFNLMDTLSNLLGTSLGIPLIFIPKKNIRK